MLTTPYFTPYLINETYNSSTFWKISSHYAIFIVGGVGEFLLFSGILGLKAIKHVNSPKVVKSFSLKFILIFKTKIDMDWLNPVSPSSNKSFSPWWWYRLYNISSFIVTSMMADWKLETGSNGNEISDHSMMVLIGSRSIMTIQKAALCLWHWESVHSILSDPSCSRWSDPDEQTASFCFGQSSPLVIWSFVTTIIEMNSSLLPGR